MAKQKKLQKDSKHNEMDLDGDGIVSDSELAASAVLTQHEKADAQRRMAWVAMGSMIVFTFAVFCLYSQMVGSRRFLTFSGYFTSAKRV